MRDEAAGLVAQTLHTDLHAPDAQRRAEPEEPD